jgi:hypothetical protein
VFLDLLLWHLVNPKQTPIKFVEPICDHHFRGQFRNYPLHHSAGALEKAAFDGDYTLCMLYQWSLSPVLRECTTQAQPDGRDEHAGREKILSPTRMKPIILKRLAVMKSPFVL